MADISPQYLPGAETLRIGERCYPVYMFSRTELCLLLTKLQQNHGISLGGLVQCTIWWLQVSPYKARNIPGCRIPAEIFLDPTQKGITRAQENDFSVPQQCKLKSLSLGHQDPNIHRLPWVKDTAEDALMSC